MITPHRRLIGPFSLLTALMLAAPAALSSVDSAADYDTTFDTTEVAEGEGAVYGRLRHLEGEVTIRRGSDVLEDLVVNEPIAPGDTVLTGPGARAEVQLADGSIVRLDQDTGLVFQSLPDGTGALEDTTILQVPHGSVIVKAESMDSGDKRFQIDTDTMSAFLLSEGIFRVDAEPGVTYVRSRRGAAEVTSNEASTMLRSGERVAVREGRMPGEAHVLNTRTGDEFDAWSDERDDFMVRTVRRDDGDYEEPEDLPPAVRPYASELSYYGHWRSTPDYGWVWSPVGVAATWQPYVYGRWSWSPAGMVWVSYEPWGWAPFHYGRWEYLAGAGWVWIPGHVFSGAHVAWSVSPGYFGWCPLGFYNYPVSFHASFGWHRDPWVFVRADRIYNHRVHTIIVRDVTIVRDIHRRAVVVRGHPRILPRRAASGPAFTERLHRDFSRRPDLQIRRPAQSDRLTPFRDGERQRLARLARRDSLAARGVRPAAPGRGQAMTADPTYSTPRTRTMQPARPTFVRGQQRGQDTFVQGQERARERRPAGVLSGTVRRDSSPRRPSSAAPQRPASAPRQPSQTSAAPQRGDPNREGTVVRRDPPAPRPESTPLVLRGQTQRPQGQSPQAQRVRESRPQEPRAAGPRQTEPRNDGPRSVEPRRAAPSSPERVIQRILPRPRQETPRPSPPPSARSSAPRSSPGPARVQPPAPRPSAQPSSPRARSSGGGSGPVRGQSGGGKGGNSGGGGKGKKSKD